MRYEATIEGLQKLQKPTIPYDEMVISWVSGIVFKYKGEIVATLDIPTKLRKTDTMTLQSLKGSLEMEIHSV